MSHKFLIIIDQLLRPIYYVLNRLKWGKYKYVESENFIVLKIFGIGSITRIVHVMETIGIKKNQVTFITLHKNRAIIDLLNIDAIYIKTNHPFVFIYSLFRVVVKTWYRKNTTLLDMERASNAAGIFRLIIGIGKPCSSFSFKPVNEYKHGQFFVSLKNKPALHAIAELFKKSYINQKKDYNIAPTSNKIYVNINSGNYCPERKFTLPEYARLIKILHYKNPNWHFYLTGLKSEFTFVESFKKRLLNLDVPPHLISNIAGKYNLSEFIAQLKNVKLCITNDSGPLHLAYLFDVKAIGIWGPTSSKLIGYPNSGKMLNLELSMSCSPCFIHPKSSVAKYCNGELTCFRSMDPEKMASKITRFAQLEKDKDLI